MPTKSKKENKVKVEQQTRDRRPFTHRYFHTEQPSQVFSHRCNTKQLFCSDGGHWYKLRQGLPVAVRETGSSCPEVCPPSEDGQSESSRVNSTVSHWAAHFVDSHRYMTMSEVCQWHFRALQHHGCSRDWNVFLQQSLSLLVDYDLRGKENQHSTVAIK